MRGPYASLVDCLLGVNCRHSFAPWAPGMPRAYGPGPEHPSGLSNDEVYDLTQKQRQIERDIRDDKRELAACQEMYDADPTPENQVELVKAKARLRKRQGKMRELIRDANARCKPGTEVLVRQPQREWAEDMPKGRLRPPQPANRTLDEFMDMPSVEAARKSAGITKAALRKEITAGLAEDSLLTKAFRMLEPRRQRNYLQDALKRLGDEKSGTAKAVKGKHAQMLPVDELHPQRIAGVIRTKEAMTFDEADGQRANPGYNSMGFGPREKNCQSSVLAHEARRRGYDVQAKPFDESNKAMIALAEEPYMAYHEQGNAAAVAQVIKPADAPTFTRFHKMCEETIKPGERYHLRFVNKEGDNHVVCIDKTEAGMLRIHDPQNETVYVGRKAREYLKRIKYRSKSYGMDVFEENYIYRVDDKVLNSKVTSEVLEARQ